eukprot:gene18252-24705_t
MACNRTQHSTTQQSQHLACASEDINNSSQTLVLEEAAIRRVGAYAMLLKAKALFRMDHLQESGCAFAAAAALAKGQDCKHSIPVSALSSGSAKAQAQHSHDVHSQSQSQVQAQSLDGSKMQGQCSTSQSLDGSKLQEQYSTSQSLDGSKLQGQYSMHSQLLSQSQSQYNEVSELQGEHAPEKNSINYHTALSMLLHKLGDLYDPKVAQCGAAVCATLWAQHAAQEEGAALAGALVSTLELPPQTGPIEPRSRYMVHDVAIPSLSPAAQDFFQLMRNTSWMIPAQLMGSSTPKCGAQIYALAKLGIRLLVTLTEEEPLPASWFRGEKGLPGPGVRNLFVPAPKYEPPSVEQMDQIMVALEECISSGHAALVHCGGGKGRAGTVLACFMCRHGITPWKPQHQQHLQYQEHQQHQQEPVQREMQGGDANEPLLPSTGAVTVLREMRPGSIETSQQLHFVGEYTKVLWKRMDPHADASDGGSSGVCVAGGEIAGGTSGDPVTRGADDGAGADARAGIGASVDACGGSGGSVGVPVASSEIVGGTSGDPVTSGAGAGADAGAGTSADTCGGGGGSAGVPVAGGEIAGGTSGDPVTSGAESRKCTEAQKHGKSVKKGKPTKPAKSIKLPKLLMLVGLPGSGKSTFSAALVRSGRGWTHVCQDECGGSRRSCEAAFGIAALRGSDVGRHVILDRCNVVVEDRKAWLDLALIGKRDKGVVAVYFDVAPEECVQRIRTRLDHPTLPPERGPKAVASFQKMLQPPTIAEGFERVYIVTSYEESNLLMQKFGASRPCDDDNDDE